MNTELEAENALIAAVMAPSGEAERPGLSKIDAQDVTNDADDTDETEQDIEAPGEVDREEGEPQAKQAVEEAPGEDEVEVPGEDGKEPTRLPLKDVLAGYQEYKRIEAQKGEVVHQAREAAAAEVREHYKQVGEFTQRTQSYLRAAMQMLQPPQAPKPPDPSLMDSDYTAWEQANARFQQEQYSYAQRVEQWRQAQGLGEQLLRQAQDAARQADDARLDQEEARLQRAWPDLFEAKTREKFVSDMREAYGYSPEELDASLTDHRNALVARDALAYRAMKASAGETKKAVEAKAPKLVRSKTEAKASPAQSRDASGRYASGALSRLQKSQSDEDAVAYFAGLSKAGRI